MFVGDPNVIEQKREAIAKVYPGEKWRYQVYKMHDAQITVVYADFLKRGLIGTVKEYTPPTGVERLTEIKEDAAFDKAISDSRPNVVQLTIDDILARRDVQKD